jgi:hypothetical protein
VKRILRNERESHAFSFAKKAAAFSRFPARAAAHEFSFRKCEGSSFSSVVSVPRWFLPWSARACSTERPSPKAATSRSLTTRGRSFTQSMMIRRDRQPVGDIAHREHSVDAARDGANGGRAHGNRIARALSRSEEKPATATLERTQSRPRKRLVRHASVHLLNGRPVCCDASGGGSSSRCTPRRSLSSSPGRRRTWRAHMPAGFARLLLEQRLELGPGRFCLARLTGGLRAAQQC